MSHSLYCSNWKALAGVCRMECGHLDGAMFANAAFENKRKADAAGSGASDPMKKAELACSPGAAALKIGIDRGAHMLDHSLPLGVRAGRRSAAAGVPLANRCASTQSHARRDARSTTQAARHAPRRTCRRCRAPPACPASPSCRTGEAAPQTAAPPRSCSAHSPDERWSIATRAWVSAQRPTATFIKDHAAAG